MLCLPFAVLLLGAASAVASSNKTSDAKDFNNLVTRVSVLESLLNVVDARSSKAQQNAANKTAKLESGMEALTSRVSSLETKMADMVKRLAALETKQETKVDATVANNKVRLAKLESNLAKDMATNTAQGKAINALKNSKCETGSQSFSPHQKSTTYHYGYHHAREDTIYIKFRHRFPTKPVVTLSVAELNYHKDCDLRLKSGVRRVTNVGFTGYVFEWHDTNIYLVTMTWTACTK